MSPYKLYHSCNDLAFHYKLTFAFFHLMMPLAGQGCGWSTVQSFVVIAAAHWLHVIAM